MDKSSNKMGIENRIEPRVPFNIKFKYIIESQTGGPGEIKNALTKDISVSGLLFENEKQVPIGTVLKIIIDIPGAQAILFELEGVVVRIEQLLPSSNFDIGVNFVKISEEQKGEIRKRIEHMDIMKLLARVYNREISDLHLTVNSPPMVRKCGELEPLGDKPLSGEEIKQMLYSILSDEQKKHFEQYKDLDFAFSPSQDVRYRVSIYQQRGKMEVVFRNIMPNIKSREELGLPDVIEDLCQLKEGLVIIGGTTGSGKSTTITTMIDIINKKRSGVILSLEKPIEYLHNNVKGIVKQREVGTDVTTFASGLKAALRQDPDIIVVGEIIDRDTMETVLEAAETGHVVITSLHSTDALQVFDRIVTFFPLDQRSFIYARLSHSLKAIIIQKLLPKKDGIGRVIATETCIVNIAVRRIIRSGDFTQLFSVIQTGSQYKMHLMRYSIDRLFEQGLIDGDTYEMHTKEIGQ